MLHKSTYVTLNRNIPACLAFSLQLNCFWTTWSIVSFSIVGASSPGTPANVDQLCSSNFHWPKYQILCLQTCALKINSGIQGPVYHVTQFGPYIGLAQIWLQFSWQRGLNKIAISVLKSNIHDYNDDLISLQCQFPDHILLQ